MSGIDIALVIMLLIGAYKGYKDGFLMELFALLGVVLGILAGFKLMGWAMLWLADEFNVDEKVLPYVAFGVVFLAVVILMTLLGRMIKLSVDKSFLGRVDEFAGALLGIIKTAFLLSVALWILDSLNVHLIERWGNDKSWLYSWIAGFAPKISHWIGNFIPIFEDVF